VTTTSGTRVDSPTFALDWWAGEPPRAGRRHVAYRGELWGCPGLRLRFGVDGWRGAVTEVPFEPVEEGIAVASIDGLDGHHTLDAVVTDGERWDNNDGNDHRLWLDHDPVDAHVHASHAGPGPFGVQALRTGLASAGIRTAVVSWRDNAFIDDLARSTRGYHALVWVTPTSPPVPAVRDRLANGHVGLKVHPSDGGFDADDRGLDPYLELAREAGRPVAFHSAPGASDPDRIRRVAERFPDLDVVLYHTYMGPPRGRQRALAHARELSNLWLETSWCSSRFTERAVEAVGADRVLFGSDGGVDGLNHYRRDPPNIELRETYTAAMLRLARRLGPDAARAVLGDNARRLFRLPA
jgi:hypothetical protein